ncbi:MAG TPA: hypothetical protein VN281_13715 [Verrucomicrobiae bacterium]|jgi:hypothetical protein|nr:hypothetical protein [Verrucomicrobiae bacterium]
MSDIKFSCPQCQQHIQAEEGYAGMEIACPVCNARMLVPGTRLVPAPVPVPVQVSSAEAAAPPPPVSRVSISRAPAAPAQAATGTRFQPGAAATARTQPARPAKTGVAGAFSNPYVYIAGAVLILSVLGFLGRSSPRMMLVFLCATLLYLLTAQIIVIVAAFRESASDGILTMICGIYSVYFVMRKSDSVVLKALYASAIVLGLAMKFIVMAGDAP